ncbi:unnamed protein product [Lepeophtheirus salmonis]|uniref:(salmon louse) hypothetical protein n=1 Tax=Lepeophtheirus salmonis TaxID=72036 RepID=A0A7R8GZS3_LEPSM|nr:unnamed protein product [Lepeophtheirus salmonis]CAF2769685.1 unnamed protein product [Lepeophtheirus salmonis]
MDFKYSSDGNAHNSKTILDKIHVNIPIEGSVNQLLVSSKPPWEEHTRKLCSIEFNEHEKRCTVIMALVHTCGKANNREIANILGINFRTVQILVSNRQHSEGHQALGRQDKFQK